ncbi:MAG: SRPBCC family protein [Acidobacteria bacterium]|nr:SRPBCC family protein [Acidobacteriota bacterium]
MIEESTSIVIDRTPDEVFAAVSDVSRMGEWSAETTKCRWVDGASGPAVGARFEGDNVAKLGPLTLKRWTTTSMVSECSPREVFEFVAEEYTTWRYEFASQGDQTRVTESFSHRPYEGLSGFVYEKVLRRPKAMVKGMKATLESMKSVLEAS